MPFMMPGDKHVNQNLTTVMIAYSQDQSDTFIADKVFPNIPTDKPTDFYNKMGRRAFLQTNMLKRAPRTETPGAEWNFTRDTFATEVWGLHNDVEDQDRASADDNWNLDRTGTELITQQALLRRELEWYSTFFSTGVWGQTDQTGVAASPAANQFLQFDQSGSSPIKLFRKARRTFHKATGVLPNFVVFGTDVWDTIIDHPEFIARIQYTQNAISISRQLVQQAIEIDNVYISEVVQATNTSDELTADPVPATAYVGNPKSFLLGYRAARPARNAPSAGYTFSWNGYLGASAFGGRIKKFRMEAISCDRIEIEMAYDYKIVAPELGQFYSAVVA
jgi:hypothetical protein